MDWLFPAITTFVFAAVFSQLVIGLSRSFPRLIRKPTGDRWNLKAIPSFGGIAIFLAFLLCYFVFYGAHQGPTLFIVMGGSIIFIVGLIDDFFPLKPYVKFIAQIAVACATIMVGIHFQGIDRPLLFIPFTLIWIVGITNAFNLLDNMDGLAGGIAFISALSLTGLSILSENSASPLVTILFASATLGFLIFNVNPAKLFMGDCGSQWLGYMLAGFTLTSTWKGATNLFLMIATPILILGIPIFDTTLVTLNRKIHGRSISQGGKDHSSHRLVALGFTEKKTVLILWGLSILFGSLALFAQLYKLESWIVLLAMGVVFLIVFALFLTDVRVYEEESIPKTSVLTKILGVQLLYKRRIIEILLDTVLVGGAYIFAYLIRFDWTMDSFQRTLLYKTLPLIVAVKLIAFQISGLYRGIWAYIDFDGLMKLAKSSLLGTLAAILSILLIYRFVGFSRSLFVVDFVVLFFFMGGARALLRALRESVFAFPESGTRLLIVGAGDAARLLLKEIRRNRQWNLTPIAFVDDDPRKVGHTLLGIPVRSTTQDIITICNSYNIDQIVIAIPSAPLPTRVRIEQLCKTTGIPYTFMESFENSLIRKIL